MDITKVSADILDGPNWGTWAVQIQAAARVLNCWAVIKGERIPAPHCPHMTYSPNQCKAQAPDKSLMQPCLPSCSLNGTR